MTNDVEELILRNNEISKLSYEENIAYLFYKEIWKFLLNINRYNYENALIKFNINKKDNQYYIYRSNGISFEMIDNNFCCKWYNYYEDCEEYYIKNVLNTNIDIKLLLRLFNSDGFTCNVIDDEIIIVIDKTIVNKNIESILLKNKILRKEL